MLANITTCLLKRHQIVPNQSIMCPCSLPLTGWSSDRLESRLSPVPPHPAKQIMNIYHIRPERGRLPDDARTITVRWFGLFGIIQTLVPSLSHASSRAPSPIRHSGDTDEPGYVASKQPHETSVTHGLKPRSVSVSSSLKGARHCYIDNRLGSSGCSGGIDSAESVSSTRISSRSDR